MTRGIMSILSTQKKIKFFAIKIKQFYLVIKKNLIKIELCLILKYFVTVALEDLA